MREKDKEKRAKKGQKYCQIVSKGKDFIVSVLLSAHVKRFSVSRIWDF